jgi:glycogen debranching enzyme
MVMKKFIEKFYNGPDSNLKTLGYLTIRELETKKGVLASDKSEIYGCIFGRDSLITSIQLMQAYESGKNGYFLRLAKKILKNILDFQGKKINIQSGEEPGKCIHEFREDSYSHLMTGEFPWFIYPDGKLRNYDSLDSTPLLLMAIYRYWKITKDKKFIESILPKIKLSLDWIFIHGDNNGDGFLDYRIHPERTYGGLSVQNWMDSKESLFHEDGRPVRYPVAPAEVQAYTYSALKCWGNYFSDELPTYANILFEKAYNLKKNFNERFIFTVDGRINIASGLDGDGNLITAARSSMGHCLWAAIDNDGILEDKYIQPAVNRILGSDLFEPLAGIRTLSSASSKFDPDSYHNGSIWPHDSGMILQGLRNFGFNNQGDQVRTAIASSINYFQTPIELFAFDGSYREYKSQNGQTACKKQAWCAATLLIL